MEIGRFYATTFGNKVYEFIVNDNGLMYCNDLSDLPLYRIIIKPRFELFGLENKQRRWILIPMNNISDFIKSFQIDDELFEFMRDNNMISYSTDMAYLYDFKDKKGYDYRYHTRAYKHFKNKEKILSKQKRGFYN